jgi:hypothetical protein
MPGQNKGRVDQKNAHLHGGAYSASMIPAGGLFSEFNPLHSIEETFFFITQYG